MDFLHGPPKNPAKNFGIVEVGNHTCKIAPKASSLTQKLTHASHPIKQKGRNVLQKIFFSITVQNIRLKSKCSAIQYTKLKSSLRLNDEMKLSDFGSAVEWQTASRDFISGQTFTRIVFLASWQNFVIIKCPVWTWLLGEIIQNVRFFDFFLRNRKKKHFPSICTTNTIKKGLFPIKSFIK